MTRWNRREVVGMAGFLAAMGISGAALAQEIAPKVEPTTIKFYNYNLASAGLGRDSTVEVLNSFAAAYPDIKVETVAPTSQEMMSRLQADMVAGQTADIAQIVFSDLSYVIENFGVVPLEDYVPAEELSAHFSGMMPSGLELGRQDGKTYGLAYVFSTPMLFYNADLFRAAGLPADTSLKTWDEVSAAAKVITEKTGRTGFSSGIFNIGFDWLYQSLVLSNGGRVISEDRKTLQFAEPPALEVIEMLRGMASAGAYTDMATGRSTESLVGQNTAMWLGTAAIQAALKRGAEGKFELRAAKLPSFGNKPARPTNSGSALVILAKDPVKRRAAWELMKHFTSDAAYAVVTSKAGYLPLRQTTIDSEKYLAGWLKENPMTMLNIEQLASMTPWVPMPGQNYKQIVNIMLSAGNRAVFDSSDPAGTMKEAQQQAQAMMP